MSWRGIFTGALALIALEAILRTDESAERLGGLLEAVGDLWRKASSPAVALIPDLAGSEAGAKKRPNQRSGGSRGF